MDNLTLSSSTDELLNVFRDLAYVSLTLDDAYKAFYIIGAEELMDVIPISYDDLADPYERCDAVQDYICYQLEN